MSPALAPCAACTKLVSAAAAACPSCGHPTEQGAEARASNRMMFQIVGALLVLALAAGAIYLGMRWIDHRANESADEQRRRL